VHCCRFAIEDKVKLLRAKAITVMEGVQPMLFQRMLQFLLQLTCDDVILKFVLLCQLSGSGTVEVVEVVRLIFLPQMIWRTRL